MPNNLLFGLGFKLAFNSSESRSAGADMILCLFSKISPSPNRLVGLHELSIVIIIHAKTKNENDRLEYENDIFEPKFTKNMCESAQFT